MKIKKKRKQLICSVDNTNALVHQHFNSDKKSKKIFYREYVALSFSESVCQILCQKFNIKQIDLSKLNKLTKKYKYIKKMAEKIEEGNLTLKEMSDIFFDLGYTLKLSVIPGIGIDKLY